jgi:hypothetical protein
MNTTLPGPCTFTGVRFSENNVDDVSSVSFALTRAGHYLYVNGSRSLVTPCSSRPVVICLAAL